MSAVAESPKSPRAESARLDLRLPKEARELLDEAAALSGTSLTEYVLSRVLPAARRDVLEARTIRLTKAAWTEFQEILDREDNERLAALRTRVPAWGEPRP